MEVITCETKQMLGRKAAEHGAQLICAAINERGGANIILATGASQNEMLDHLVRNNDIYWPTVTVFHLDEYIGMPITHPASFRLYLWTRFVRMLPLPLRACHYINAERDPLAECARVGEIIKQQPIDVAFVGIGENCHMAFNDPPADFNAKDPYLVVQLADRCRQQQVGEGWFKRLDDVPRKAISISIRQLMTSRAIIASVPDSRKAQAVKDTVEHPVDPLYPATCLKQHNQAYVYLDVQSASLLSDTAAA